MLCKARNLYTRAINCSITSFSHGCVGAAAWNIMLRGIILLQAASSLCLCVCEIISCARERLCYSHRREARNIKSLGKIAEKYPTHSLSLSLSCQRWIIQARRFIQRWRTRAKKKSSSKRSKKLAIKFERTGTFKRSARRKTQRALDPQECI